MKRSIVTGAAFLREIKDPNKNLHRPFAKTRGFAILSDVRQFIDDGRRVHMLKDAVVYNFKQGDV